MTRAQMLAELRAVIDDTMPDYGWTDSRLLGYLEEGQDYFCEKTGYFVDFTNFMITTVADQAVYAIPDRVIEVLDIFNGTTRMGKIEERDREWPSYPEQPIQFDFSEAVSPSYWQADEEIEAVRVFPTPTTIVTLNMRVWRYSRYELTDDDYDGQGNPAVPEIPSRFQRACIEWAAYKAFMEHDMERQDKVKAGDHLAAFDRYVSDGRTARRRKMGQSPHLGGNPAYVVGG